MARKKEISDGFMAYYSTHETSAIEPAKQFESRLKKGDRKEEVTEVSMKLFLFFCLPGHPSLVFIDEEHQ